MSREKLPKLTTFGARLRFLRDNIIEISRKKFVKGLGISEDTLINYENDETLPDIIFPQRLWDKYNKILTPEDLNWLLPGQNYETAPPDEYARVPLYDVHASAGGGAFVAEEAVKDVLVFRKEWIANELRASVKDLAVIFVEGDSMTPTLNPGDILLVHKHNDEALKDGIYVIRLEDTLLVKRLQRLPGARLQVSSDNPAYSVFNVNLTHTDTDFAIIGRVVWAGKRF